MFRIRVSPSARNERGIALVAALLVVLLMSVLAATFIATTVSERSVSSNTHVARASLLSADAGIRASQQAMANFAQAKLDTTIGNWNGIGAVITTPATFFNTAPLAWTGTNPAYSSTATITWADSTLKDSAQTYNYNYTIVSTGSFGQVGSRRVSSQGVLRVSASRGSFTDFLMFTNVHTMSDGSPIWFTSSSSFDGRVHTNDEFRFAFKPTFQDLVSSVDQKAWFNNKGSNLELNASKNGTIDVPQFSGGFTRNADQIDLPANSYSQQNAALGLSPGSTTVPANTVINTKLGTANGSSPPPNGIYLPKSGSALTGGIYVQGNLDRCTMSVDGSGNQVYYMKQGSNTSTITIDRYSNTTTVLKTGSGSGTTTYAGVPLGIMYTNGNMADLRGPDRVSGDPPPAIAQDNQLLIAATGDITVQRDITYEDYTAGDNVLGIYTSGGKVVVGSGAPDDMNLDAYVMAASANGDFEVDNYDGGSARGTFHLRGGLVEQFYGPFFTFDGGTGDLKTGYARDFHYDRRGLSPPYFPLTNKFKADEPGARTLAWKEL